nr:uncharacterized protein LOC110383731 [Helicoverpa armigera]
MSSLTIVACLLIVITGTFAVPILIDLNSELPVKSAYNPDKSVHSLEDPENGNASPVKSLFSESLIAPYMEVKESRILRRTVRHLIQEPNCAKDMKWCEGQCRDYESCKKIQEDDEE